MEIQLNELVGHIITSVEGLFKGSEEVIIRTGTGQGYAFLHFQDCCEDVRLEDFEQDTEDFNGALILSAESVTNNDDIEGTEPSDESHTWTFYKIETSKGGIWMRWLGASNGYYGEEVSFIRRD